MASIFLHRVAREGAQLGTFHAGIEAAANHPPVHVADDDDVIAVGEIRDASGFDFDELGKAEHADFRSQLLNELADRLPAKLADDVVDTDERLPLYHSGTQPFFQFLLVLAGADHWHGLTRWRSSSRY